MPDQVDWRALEREASPGRAVGRLLRDQREARGLDLATVEKSLKIRRANLEAIEEGRFDKLPGAAYIPAFLRAYASHVGLDPEKVMTAYHLSGPVPIKRPVTLPADFPIVERRAPIGLAVLTVLLVVGVGYAAWHYLPREQSVVAEKVPPVPDRLLASSPNPAPSTDAHPPAATTSTPAPVVSGQGTQSVPPSQEARPAPGNLPAEVWPARRETAAPPPPQPPQGTPLAPPVVAAVPPPPPPPVMMNLPGPGQAQAAQPPAGAEQPRVATQQPPQQAAAPAVEEAARPPAAEPASVPVRADTTVRVRGNSWIELRAPNGDVLAQTYVRAGESYVVPAGIAYRIVDAR
ncbi:helix-turn-helix domain-containing protein [Reyranella soli]|jgi:cytoskeleton protein RodZ|uniref:helix-turn-helix domain-containing protein n=1 Tax=Reyranella soli TaxID=1230389 RepID=UPI0011BD77B7|nr:helix-turn-helix domain-containing protein [Reyranella soli]